MKYLTIFILSTIISSFALANFEIPNQFEDGQVTSAAEMNANFQAIKAAIDVLNTAQSDVVTFQGYSAPIAGTAGVHAFASACETVSIGSRICTGDELTLSPSSNAPTDLDGYAWIAKELTSASITSSFDDDQWQTQIHERKWHGRLKSCLTGDAHVIKNGRFPIFSGISCDDTYPVACCK